MKIGLISDIHGNATALKKVLEKLSPHVNKILCAGDMVGYLPDINEVFDLVREHNIDFIIGNHDYMLLENNSSDSNLLIKNSIEYAKKVILPENFKLLKKSLASKRMKIDDVDILLIHGGPNDPLNEYVYPNSYLLKKFVHLGADVVIFGHTHIPMIKKVDNTIIINPGSSGLSRDADPRVSYAIIDTKNIESIELGRIVYDIDKTYQRIVSAGFSDEFRNKIVKYLYMGCYIEEISIFEGRLLLREIADELTHFIPFDYRIHVFSREILIESPNPSSFVSIFISDKINKNILIRTSPFCYEWTINNAGHNIFNSIQKNEYHIKYAGHGYFIMKRLSLSGIEKLSDIIFELFELCDRFRSRYER